MNLSSPLGERCVICCVSIQNHGEKRGGVRLRGMKGSHEDTYVAAILVLLGVDVSNVRNN